MAGKRCRCSQSQPGYGLSVWALHGVAKVQMLENKKISLEHKMSKYSK